MKYQPQTWHYGIVAQSWAEFQNYSVDGPEIAYYQKFIERYGQPHSMSRVARVVCCCPIYRLLWM